MTDGQPSSLASSTGTDRVGRSAAAARWWWALLFLPLWAVLALCAHWEPVMRDGWGHLAWFREGPGHGLYEFARECYLRENPRLGQIFTLLAYAPGPYHVIVTPLVELAVLGLLTAVAIGRWPRLSRVEDAFAMALVSAIVFACMPQIGPMLVYRPFTWNYLFGLGLSLAWLLPYRLELVEPRPRRVWRTPLVFVLGVAAGLCNEHTGVAFAAMATLATLAARRRGRLRPWMIAGLVGLVAGYVVLLTAPAQHLRYQGLGAQVGILARIAHRGLAGNLRVLLALGWALWPALPLVALGLSQRPRAAEPAAASDRGSHAALAIGGLVCTLTLLASPKIGPRLHSASVALIAAALTGWFVGRLGDGWARRACTALAAAALVVVSVRLVAIHRVIGPLGAIRRDRIEHGAPGSVVTLPRFPVAMSRYFLGDDFRVGATRDSIAHDYGLGGIALEPELPPGHPGPP